MMSELGKEIYKVVPALELSTQDFILGSKDKEAGVTTSVTLRFSISQQQSLNGCPSKICFNKDGKYYTPVFIDHAFEPISKDADRFLREVFEKKIVESSNSKIQLFEPKPSSDYCSICKEPFNDYLKHITHPIHTKKLAASSCNDYISDLCSLVNKRSRKSEQHNSEEEQLSGSSRKRRKMEDSMKCSFSHNNLNQTLPAFRQMFQQQNLLISEMK